MISRAIKSADPAPDANDMRWEREDIASQPQTWNVVALIKGHERFVFVYDETSRDMLIDEIRYQAADPDSPINWHDAGLLTQKIRQASETLHQNHPFPAVHTEESPDYDSTED
jgi:hypothetical protein